MMTVGKNSIAGKELLGFVERIERLRAEKKGLSQDEAAVMADAKAQGFVPAAIRYVIKARAMKPHDREESETLRDLYMHACGMGEPGPLFRSVGLMGVDVNAKEEVTDALKLLVPANGEIVVTVKGKSVRLWRDKDGKAQSEDVQPKRMEPTAKRSTQLEPRNKAPVPEVDGDQAEAMGVEAYNENQPITANPFPFGNKNRARWDKGWRRGSGTDGMGPMESLPDAGDEPDDGEEG